MSTWPSLIADNHVVRLLLKSALAGAVVAFLLLLLLHWPTPDSDSELKLVMAFALALFPLSMVAALLVRLPAWPTVGLVAPFAMLMIALIQPDYDRWVPEGISRSTSSSRSLRRPASFSRLCSVRCSSVRLRNHSPWATRDAVTSRGERG